jgi:multisubunit Na+/H+ antiporter MnhF subunit
MIINFAIFILFLCVVITTLLMLWQKNTIKKLIFLNTLNSLSVLTICTLSAYSANDYYLVLDIIYFLLTSLETIEYLKYYIQKKK